MSKDIFFKFIKDLSSSIDYSPSFCFKAKQKKRACANLYLNHKFAYNSVLDFEKLKPNRERVIHQLKHNFITLRSFEIDSGDRLLDQHLLIFKERLLMWERYLHQFNLKGLYDSYTILLRNLSEGPVFADHLKNSYDYSIRASHGIDFIYNEEYDIISKLEDVNQIYPANRLLNWKRSPSLSDMEDYCFKEPKISNIDYTLDLQRVMKKYMKKNLPLFHKDLFDDIKLSNEKSSMNGKTFTDRMYSGFQNPSDKYGELNFRITSVHKSPCESRTVAVADPSSRNFIYTVRKNYKDILKCPYDKYGSKPWHVFSKLNEEQKKVFFMFDQKKCGWTFPMELMELFFGTLSLLYPDFWEFQKMKEIFENKNIYYYFDKKRKKPKRGFTLGMFDDAVSFIMACLFEVYVEKMSQTYILQDQKDLVEGLFFGDDCLIIFKDDDKVDWRTASVQWMVFLDSLGISINSKKSFHSNFGIFCEMYGSCDTLHTFKNIQYLTGVYDVLLCYNTAHAKSIMCSYKRSYDEYLKWVPPSRKDYLIEVINSSISDIINSFPYEFDENELDLPFEVGGWFSNFCEKGNLFLSEVFKGKYNSLLKLHLTEFPKNLIKFTKNKKLHKIYSDFFNNERIKIVETDIAYFELKNMLNLQDKLDDFILQSDPKAMCKAWWKYQHDRILNYKNPSGLLLSEERKIFEKNFINSVITLDMVDDIGHADHFYINKLPIALHAKCKYKIEPERALCLLYQRSGKEDPFGVSHTGKISLNDLIMNVDYDLSTSNHIIPTDWWILCKTFNIKVNDLKTKLWECGIDPMFFIPKFCKKYKTIEKTVPQHIKIEREYIYYEPNLGLYINCDGYELHHLLLLDEVISLEYIFFITNMINVPEYYYSYKRDIIENDNYDTLNSEIVIDNDDLDEISKQILQQGVCIDDIKFPQKEEKNVQPVLDFMLKTKEDIQKENDDFFNEMWDEEGEPLSDDENYIDLKRNKGDIMLELGDDPEWANYLDNMDGGLSNDDTLSEYGVQSSTTMDECTILDTDESDG